MPSDACSLPSTDAVARQGFHLHVASDADDQAIGLTGWSQLYDQLAPGRFAGSIREFWVNGLQVFHESTSHTLRQSCVVDSESWWFGIPLALPGTCRLGSSAIEEGSIAVRPGNTQFELLTPSSFEILGIVVPHKELERHIYALNRSHTLPRAMQNGLLKIGAGRYMRLQSLIQQVLEETAYSPEVAANPAAREGIRVSVMDALTEACSSHESTGRAPDRQLNHYKIVREVRNYLLERQEETVTVVDLCQAFDVSRRTLQYAFQHVMGMNPNAYLRAIRLNGVRRSLRDPMSGVNSVQQAAADWGFWHLSQFARDYRSLFGELPSERLKRRTAAISQ